MFARPVIKVLTANYHRGDILIMYSKILENPAISLMGFLPQNKIVSKNNNLLYKSSIKRNDKTLGNIDDQYLINRIFEKDSKEIELFESTDSLIAIKIIKTRTDNYNFDEKIFKDLNLSFSKSFFNDISNFYVQHLASKHKLQRRYEDLEKFFRIIY